MFPLGSQRGVVQRRGYKGALGNLKEASESVRLRPPPLKDILSSRFLTNTDSMTFPKILRQVNPEDPAWPRVT